MNRRLLSLVFVLTFCGHQSAVHAGDPPYWSTFSMIAVDPATVWPVSPSHRARGRSTRPISSLPASVRAMESSSARRRCCSETTHEAFSC